MLTIAIQAGGRSSRMGTDKGLVELAGKPMIEHVIAAVSDLADELLITTNVPESYAYLGYKMASDEEPGAGALPGLLTALKAASGDHVLVVATDMPLLNPAFLHYMVGLVSGAQIIIPQWQERLQPMHAVYEREPTLAAVTHALASGKKRMISFHDQLTVHTIPPEKVAEFDADGQMFFNVNTPEDSAEAERLLSNAE